MSIIRQLARVANRIDSASTGTFLSKGDSTGDFTTVNYTDLSGRPTTLDSAALTSIVDSAYIQLRQTSAGSGGLDSAGITALVDSNYVVARSPAAASGFAQYEYTATAGQTTFQDSDINGNVMSYTADGIFVFYNGVLIAPTTDYEASDGSSIVLTTGADSGSHVAISKWSVASAGGGAGAAAWYGARGLFAGGSDGGGVYLNTIEYVTIASPGNATDFGDLTIIRNQTMAASDATYGVWAGGYSSVSDVSSYIQTVIDYVTISTTGNATDFGDITRGRLSEGCGDGTYGLFHIGLGASGASNTIEYVTIASPGNSADFGDLTVTRFGTSSFNDATYACWAGGNTSGNTIDYVTMASPGNATDFGDLTADRQYGCGTGDTTYGLTGGGLNPNASSIDYVTVATPGNASDFGDLSVGRRYLSACSDATYGVFGGGEQNDSPYSVLNVMDYVTIASPGNATDFGDLTSRQGISALSGSPS